MTYAMHDTATDEAARMFTDHLRALALGALPKTVEELTESEKFAICFYAGHAQDQGDRSARARPCGVHRAGMADRKRTVLELFAPWQRVSEATVNELAREFAAHITAETAAIHDVAESLRVQARALIAERDAFAADCLRLKTELERAEAALAKLGAK